MDILQAKEIIKSLADGVNPLTGEVISKYDVCNQVEIVRALYCVLNALDDEETKPKKNLPENAGKPWTSDEDSVLTGEFKTGLKPSEIAVLHKRTQGSIQSHLVRLGLIENSHLAER